MPTTAMRIQKRMDTCTLVVAPPPSAIWKFHPNSDANGSLAIFVGSIGMYVIGLTLDVSTDDAPRMMNKVASVTMNDGRPVLTTMTPLIAPRTVARTIARMIPNQTGMPPMVTTMPMMIPAKPTIDPIE